MKSSKRERERDHPQRISKAFLVAWEADISICIKLNFSETGQEENFFSEAAAVRKLVQCSKSVGEVL